MDKVLRQICDFITVVVLVICVGCFTSFATIGDPDFYRGYYNDDTVREEIEDEISKVNDDIARKYGIEEPAFDYALSKKIDLNRILNNIPSSIFNGVNSKYSQIEDLDIAYKEGIVEYHELNGLTYDEQAVNECTVLACENFDSVLGANQMSELSKGVNMVDKNAKTGGVICLFVLIFLITRIFALNFGRTKTFAHLGSVLIGSGCVFITTFVMNILLDFVTKLNVTSNQLLNDAITYGVDKYFKLLAIFGIVLILLGAICMRYVYDYYMKKHSYQLQEKLINEKIRNDAQKALEYTNNEDNIENGDSENGIN